jgi:hypothetical protein
MLNDTFGDLHVLSISSSVIEISLFHELQNGKDGKVPRCSHHIGQGEFFAVNDNMLTLIGHAVSQILPMSHKDVGECTGASHYSLPNYRRALTV